MSPLLRAPCYTFELYPPILNVGKEEEVGRAVFRYVALPELGELPLRETPWPRSLRTPR